MEHYDYKIKELLDSSEKVHPICITVRPPLIKVKGEFEHIGDRTQSR